MVPVTVDGGLDAPADGKEELWKHSMNQKWKEKPKVEVVVAAVALATMYPDDLKPKDYKDVVEVGPVRIPLYARENPFGNSYRMLVASRYYTRKQEQWLDMERIPDVIEALKKVEKKYKKAKRHLEGGILRRVIRFLF